MNDANNQQVRKTLRWLVRTGQIKRYKPKRESAFIAYIIGITTGLIIGLLAGIPLGYILLKGV